MAWPTTTITTTDMDAGTDSPAVARAQIKQMADDINAMIAALNAALGVAGLDASGLIATTQLPTIPANKGGTGQTAFTVGDIFFREYQLDHFQAGGVHFRLCAEIERCRGSAELADGRRRPEFRHACGVSAGHCADGLDARRYGGNQRQCDALAYRRIGWRWRLARIQFVGWSNNYWRHDAD